MNNQVKEIVFTGPDGKLVGKYKKGQSLNPPIALLIHPHPLYGGTMNNPIVMDLFSIFDSLGFSIFRFNLRGVGKSEGKFDNGLGELADAAAGLDWIQRQNPNTNQCWVAGFSFGALLCMQLLMRRPEITRFVSISPQPNLYDFNFLSPCPIKTMIIRAEQDEIVKKDSLKEFFETFKKQKNAEVSLETISKANHLFEGKLDPLMGTMTKYINKHKL